MSFAIGPSPGLPFVGWAHLSIRDSDGHSRQVKGSSAQTPLIASSNDSSITIEAELTITNPLSFIKISNEDSYYFTASFILGSCHHGHRALDHILLQTIPVPCTYFKDQTEVSLECIVPFAKAGSNRCQMTVSLSEYKLVTKVSKLKVQMPLAMVAEAYLYRDGLRKYRKLDNNDEDEKSKSAPTPSE